jgi:N-acetyl-1-D-myo-inositol-2-amino-2-deoxy-alpha-D-glucopyranoside deacetylase
MTTTIDAPTPAALLPTVATAGQRLLVTVAHPDDETFGCGSIIATAVAAGATVTVLCATLGDRGETHLGLTREQLTRQRLRELQLAAGVLGVTEVITLTYGDSDFGGDVPEDSLCAADAAVVTADVAAVMARVRPDAVVTLDGCDGHRDHIRMRDATRAACDGGVVLYEATLPNHLMRRWLDEQRITNPNAAYHAIDPGAFGRPDHEVTHVIDARSVLATRELAIAMHVSQASPFDGLSPELREAFLATDHLVRVR